MSIKDAFENNLRHFYGAYFEHKTEDIRKAVSAIKFTGKNHLAVLAFSNRVHVSYNHNSESYELWCPLKGVSKNCYETLEPGQYVLKDYFKKSEPVWPMSGDEFEKDYYLAKIQPTGHTRL
jgi:hypothetical protein